MASITDIERKQLLLPVVASAVAAAGTFAARKVPGMVGGSIVPALKEKAGDTAEQVKDQVEDTGGPLGLAAKAADKVGGIGGGGGSRGQGPGKGRRLPIQASIDVPVPVSFAYERWTNFKQLGKFLHRVESVEQKGDNRVIWHENIWGRKRTWRAEITEKRTNQLIAWKDEHGVGVLSFHQLAPRLTRIELNYDWMPHGMVEKLASGLRFHKRAARTDLQRFKAHAETEYAKHRNRKAGQSTRKAASPRSRSTGTRQAQRA